MIYEAERMKDKGKYDEKEERRTGQTQRRERPGGEIGR
jgi:hypothetical protein